MKKPPKIIQNLSSEQFMELKRVINDPFFFSEFIYVINSMFGRTQFKLYPYQKAVLWEFLTKRFNIILKFRQAGLTELIAMYALWLAMYHPEKNILIISIKERVAKRLLKKIKYMYRNLPEHLKTPVINGRGEDIGTATELEFSNGSLITSVPTTEDAGRSEALSLLIIDEAAIVKWANTIWAAAFPTLSTGGSAILNSTPYGVGNFFHKTWVDSCAKGNNFNPIRLRWQMHPDRDIHWYNEQRLILGPRRTAQEIDGDFLTSGNNVFDLLDIRAIEDMLDEYTLYDTKNDARFNKLTTFNGQLQIFGPPIKGETYFIGSDIATGRARDYSSLTLMDKHGEEHAVFKGKIPINAHTKLLGDLGKIYNWAHLAPEANDIGLGVAMKLSEQGYRNLYYSKKLLREKGMTKPKEEKIPGWYTTKRNRPVIIGGLEEDIRLNNIIIKDRAFVNEAYTFIYDNENKPVAMGKGGSNSEEEMDGEEYTDDAILGKSITNHIRKGKVNSINVMPK